MKYMFLLAGDEAEWSTRTPKIAEHQALERTMDEAGKFLDGKALMPRSEAVTVRRRGDEFVVTDGPFAETKEQIGGYYLFEADSMEEALDWAKQLPPPEGSDVHEVRPARTGAQWRGALQGKQKYMLLFVVNAEKAARQTREEVFGLVDLHYELSLELAAQGKFSGSRSLAPAEEAVCLRAGPQGTVVTDGPFAETKEFVAGYIVVACDEKEEAVELAKTLTFGLEAVEVRPLWNY